MSGRTYLTTTLPYVNADPHIGFALELVQADIIARYKKLTGEEVFFNTGTDEHGQKIWQKANEAKTDVQKYVDDYASRFKSLPEKLDILPEINFIRTTDKYHLKAAQEFWTKCDQAGDIYKKVYKVKYCVGCELEKTDSELVDGRCPVHPNQEPELIEEENYFFRFSKYQNQLLKLYTDNPEFVVPAGRLNEIKTFVTGGLQDFSVSRLASKMPWGIPVPGDESQVMYVWFDALVNYISAIGWPDDEKKFNDWWPALQFAGKDNLRQQSAMWQAMLMSAGLPASKQIMIHGFINSGGQKMSKSLGNVINPVTIVDEYGADALRYYLARHINPFEDSDFTMEKFKEAYNAGLANGLGNLVSRVMKMAQDNLTEVIAVDNVGYRFKDYLSESLDQYRFDFAMDYIWQKIAELDQEIQDKKPWESKDLEVIKNLVIKLYQIGCMLEPFMPKVSKTIIESTRNNTKPENLFPRKD